jgi:predicted RNA polymerase sigma factor
LREVPPATAVAYHPHWAVDAHLLRRLGRPAEARAAAARAVGLTEDPAVRAYPLAQAGAQPSSSA